MSIVKCKHVYLRIILVGAIIGCVMIFLTACNSERRVENNWSYVAEFIPVDDEDCYFKNAQIFGDSIYFHSPTLCQYSVENAQITDVLLKWQIKGTNRTIEGFYISDDGSRYLVTKENVEKQILYKFDNQGTQIFSSDITNQMEDGLSGIRVDAKSRIYVGSGTRVWLFNEAGEEQGYISLENTNARIANMGSDRKGNMYIGYYESSNQGFLDLGNLSLAELDFDNKRITASYSDLALGNVNMLLPGIEENFLIYDNVGVYDYNIEMQTKSLIFEWMDCNINGSFVNCIGCLSDGRFVVIYDDRLNEERGIALVSKTEKNQVTQREDIVVATMYYNSWLQNAALNFNKSNDKYKVVIQQYAEKDSGEMVAMSDAIVNLYNDLSASGCPDIIDLSELDIEQLAAADILEDMTPYLKNSSTLKRTDFLENILEEYTIDGELLTIPHKFTICTVVGSSEKVGDKAGWTIDEIRNFANAYPEAELFGKIEKREILQYLMMLNQDIFIDWQTGESNFDSEQFKELLQFVYDLPNQTKQNSSEPIGAAIDVDGLNGETFSNPVRIQKGEVLLDIEYVFNFDMIQMNKEMFHDEVVCVGFPTLDGTEGHILFPLHAYGITTKSNCKEGAWRFIESLLLQEENGNEYGFPTRKAELEAMINRTLNFGYLLDEYGELILDEEGKPIENQEQLPTSVSNDGWSYTCRRTTQDEIDIILAVLAKAKRVSDRNNIMQIISEEVDAYFLDQKALNDVVKIIQSRVGIYVEETRW